MSENGVSRGTHESSWHEAILSQASPSGLLELHRRCFSCCNVVLRQEASLVQSHERTMLLEQPMFTEHVMMKAIMARVSGQKYTGMRDFVDDITKFVDTCVAECDRRAVLGALMTHVAKIGQPDYKRPSKTTFHGFPHPLLEEMLAQTTAARKKMTPSRSHATVDIGRSLARSYGLGLTSGARFIGQPSKEKAFHAQRKEREIERANAISAETAAAALKAQKRNKAKEKGSEGTKKKQKVQSSGFNAAVTPKPTRSLRATRRMAMEDGADELPLSDTPNSVAAKTGARSSDVTGRNGKCSVVAQRVLKRERVHCPHQQGQEVEMCDEEYEGNGYTGTIRGTAVVCHCGCEGTMKGTHWLLHNGGRPNNRHPGYPWKYMRMVATNQKLADHWLECDCHEHLCDSCHSWEEPGFPIVACSKCGTSVHAAEGCATPIPRPTEKKSVAAPESVEDMDPEATAKASTASTAAAAAAAAGDDVSMPPPTAKARSRSVRRKGFVRAKTDAAGCNASMDSGGSSGISADEPEAEDPNVVEWVCQICTGTRSEKEKFSTSRRQKPSARLAAS